MRLPFRIVFASFLALASVCAAPRERIRLDAGWRFHLGNEWGAGISLTKAGTGYGPASVTFSDASWRPVDLPHDWAVELPFDRNADLSHGFKAIGAGFAANNIGWYRRRFDLAAGDTGRRIWLEFDGVYRDCTVFVNGWRIGRHESGYSSFRYDVTDMVNCGGANTLAVRVDASVPEGWFYEGAGIYRHVWLVKTAATAIAPDGVCVRSRLPGGAAPGPVELFFATDILNQESGAAGVHVTWQVLGPEGAAVAHAGADVTPADVGAVATAAGSARLTDPKLWSPEMPALYRLVTTVRRSGEVLDEQSTDFGVRSFAFDHEKGFLLNGKPYPLQGTCNHQDHAGVGSAIPDAVQFFRIAKLKEMGSNALRTSHNPPTPELLDACDRLGMLVMDENRLLGSDPDTQQRWTEQIRRDRNHASVAIWSVANEEFSVQATPAGAQAAATLQAIAHRLDPTRPVTYAAPVGNEPAGINSIIDVRGWNYHVGGDMDAYHAQHPRQPNVGTEQGSTTGTRGIYTSDPIRGYVSAYDDTAPEWATTAHRWVTYFAPRPWLSGGFVWTGFDYRGEPTPYGWPCVNSHFGIMDTCGFPKDNYWYYQAWWSRRTVLHLFPHWNWAGREGQPIDVRAFTNCEAVELFLNGRSLGRKTLTQPGQLQWSVPYAPGTLSAKGFRQGNEIAQDRVETTGAPAALRLSADRRTLTADGRDAVVFAVAVVDRQGRVVPDASAPVGFALDGTGTIIGVGNGDPSCHEPDQYVSNPAVTSVPLRGWHWHPVADTYAAKLAEADPAFDDSGWAPVDETAEHGILKARQRGVFRASFPVSADELAAGALELCFGRIEGDASVFLNGEKLGGGGDPSAPTVFDLGNRLRPGRNVVAVAIANYSETSGLARGVSLHQVKPAAAVHWSRTTFNGLAEVIVRAPHAPETVTLHAQAPGLAPATLEVAAR